MRNKILAALSAFLVLLGLSIVAAPAASAGTCTVVGPVQYCGKVYNGTNFTVLVTDNWPASNGNKYHVPPGAWSPYKDTDGFYIPSGKCFSLVRGPVWFKVTDTSTVKLNNVNLFSC